MELNNNNNKGGYKFEKKRENFKQGPDREKFRTQLAKYQTDITAFTELIKKDEQLLKQAFSDRKEEVNEFSQYRDEIDKIKLEIFNLLKLKTNLVESTSKKVPNTTQQKSIPEKTQNKKPLTFNHASLVELQSEISNLEKKMMTSTLTLKEEKEMMAKIESLNQKLRTTRQQEAKYIQETKKLQEAISKRPSAVTNESIVQDTKNVSDKSAQIEEIDHTVELLKKKKDALNEKWKIAQKQTTWKPELIDELKLKIKNNRIQKDNLIAERDEVKANFKVESDKFAEEIQKRKLERAEKQKETKAQKEIEQLTRQLELELQKLEDSPHLQNYHKLNNLYTYVQKLIADKTSKETENKSSKGKSSKSKGALTFDMSTLNLFMKFNIESPMKEEDLEDALKQIDEKLVVMKKEADEISSAQTTKKKEIEKQLAELQAKN